MLSKFRVPAASFSPALLRTATRSKATTSPYFDIKSDHESGQKYMECNISGVAALRLPQINKGTAFTFEERESLHLEGLLPPAVNTMEQQLAKNWRRYQGIRDPLQKYQYLRDLQERNEHLYYALIIEHLEDCLPIIYTPTVGDACRQYSHMYNYARGLSFSPRNIQNAEAIVGGYYLSDIRMIVATDSSAILGIGDQGYGGMGIPIGKLALYTAAGGVSPFQTCPVTLDIGTNRKDLIKDSLYLGIRQPRMKGKEYMEFMEKFVEAVKRNWPRAIIQWEDFSKDAAFGVLDRFRDEIPSFNDDIQGTGAVTLAGVIAACKMIGTRLRDQVVVISGAGAGGAGVAWIIEEGMKRDGLSAQEARDRVYVLDSAGLLYHGREKMEDYKLKFLSPASCAKWAESETGIPTLMETVTKSKCTCLLGLSGTPGQFTEPIVREVASHCERPIIFPLSNPTSSCEALPEDIFKWTNGKALVASGSPFAPVVWEGKEHPIGQGNNAFVFPGLGAGAIIAGVKKVTDNMIMEASFACADYTIANWLSKGRIYPPIREMRKVSVQIATRVIQQAIADKVATGDIIKETNIEERVRREFWQPEYPHIIRRAFGTH